MRKVIFASLLCPALAVAQNARMESNDNQPRIVATATRTTHIAPDRATLYFTIEGGGETVAEASQRGAQKLQAVMSALQPLAGRDGISSVAYGVTPAINLQGFPGMSSSTPYQSRYLIRVQTNRMDQITQLAGAAITAGASATSPPSFEASASDSVRRVRSTEALAQARADAESLARALGGHLGSIIEASSNAAPGQQFGPNYVSFMNRYEFSGPLPPPDVVVNATVTVRYNFVQ